MRSSCVLLAALLALAAYYVYIPLPSTVSDPWKLMLLDATFRGAQQVVSRAKGDAPCRPCSRKRNPHRLSRLPMGPLRMSHLHPCPAIGISRVPVKAHLPFPASSDPRALRVSCVHPCNAVGASGVTHVSPSARFPRTPIPGTEGVVFASFKCAGRYEKQVKFSPGVSDSCLTFPWS